MILNSDIVDAASNGEVVVNVTATTKKRLADASSEIQSQVKEYYSTMGKFSKALEKARHSQFQLIDVEVYPQSGPGSATRSV